VLGEDNYLSWILKKIIIMEKNKALYQELISLIAPGIISEKFELSSILEKTETITLFFEEKKELIPEELLGKEVVFDGFVNHVDLQSFPLKDKKVYLSIRRRRWKEKGTLVPSYSNQYELYNKGMKTTKEFGIFLKEELGLQPDEFNKLWESTSP